MSNPNYKYEPVNLTLQIQEDCFESIVLILFACLVRLFVEIAFCFLSLSAKFLPIHAFKLQVEGINFLFYLFNRV